VPTKAVETVCLFIVGREPAVLRLLWSVAESNCWHLETEGSGWDAMERLQTGAVPDLLLLELSGRDGDGLHVLQWLRRLHPDLPIILISQTDDVECKQEAIRLGAQEILVRPLDEQQLEFIIRKNLGSPRSGAKIDIGSDDVEPLGGGAFFVGASPAMGKLRAQAELLAQAPVPVLILGESGSGKSAAAQLIHGLSVRSGFKLLRVNCAALPSRLLEEELFGCESGVETGFARGRAGKLELCERGTLLLDEIVEMPPDLQSKLLQVLQSKRLLRLGGEKPIDVDVRILAATSAKIEHAVAAKKLREDLYYRLSAFTLHVPPLRQRKDEIPVLLHHFMHQLAKHYSLPPRTFSPGVLEACQGYSWPGNLSELEGFVKRYLMMPDHERAAPHESVLGGMEGVGSCILPLAVPVAQVASDPGSKPLRRTRSNRCRT
jgi:two-component system response regulator AtoC